MKTSINKYKYICQWKKEHPEKIREYRKIWEKRYPDSQRACLKRWREKHPDYMKNYYKKHPRTLTYIRKSPEDLRYERNKLIYQARTIQKLTFKEIGKMFRGKKGKPLSKQRIGQIIIEHQRILDKQK